MGNNEQVIFGVDLGGTSTWVGLLHWRVWLGRFGMGREVGHSTVKPNGLRCGCGSRGCKEPTFLA